VAVEEPDPRVIGDKAEGDAYARVDDDRVASHGGGGCAVETGPLGLIAGAGDDLELMAVEMEWMRACVVVVEVDFDDGAVRDNLWVDLAVDLGILLVFGRCR